MSCWRTLAYVSLMLVLPIAACSVPVPPSPEGSTVIYVIHRAWHTDIGLPVETIAGPLAALEKPFPGVRFLTFGFGERQFLINHRRTSGAMLSALFPSRSALLMTALSVKPEAAFGPENVVVLHVTPAGFKQIEAAIWRELETSVTDEPTMLAGGPYPGSVFYAARDTYDAFYTCNTWTAATIQAGGLPMPTGVLFAGQIMGMAKWISRTQIEAQGRQTMPAAPATIRGH